MDDFVWIFVLLAVWLFEIAGKALKKQKLPPGEGEVRSPRPDPRASAQELSREVDASARRAEEALVRWEQEQHEVVRVPVPAAAGGRVDRKSRRREAFKAIAGMLATPSEGMKSPERMKSPPRMKRVMEAPSRVSADKPRQPSAVTPVVKLAAPASVRRHTRRGFGRLAGLPELQRAVLLREILGPPVSLSQPGESRSAWD